MSSSHALCLSIVQNDSTALHQATAGGHLDVVRALIQGGCDLNAVVNVSLFMIY